MATNQSLLNQFIKEECTPYVRGLICGAIARHKQGASSARAQFEFNRFNLTLDFEDRSATLEDELDTTPSGRLRLPLGQLVAELGC